MKKKPSRRKNVTIYVVFNSVENSLKKNDEWVRMMSFLLKLSLTQIEFQSKL